MTDQRHRNAYKRWWRNLRNSERAINDAEAALRRAIRSNTLAAQAQQEMEMSR